MTIQPRLLSLSGNEATFADGSRTTISAVLWATGYEDDADWIVVDGALDARGRFLELEGLSPVHGLYAVGRSWQRTRGSALLLGVGEDARHVVTAITRQLHDPGPHAVQSLQP